MRAGATLQGMDMLMSPVVLIAMTFLLAGAVKGIVGLGLPTIAMGLLGLWLPPAEAAALLLLPSLVTNVQQYVTGPHLREVTRRLWPMGIAIALGTAIGASVIVRADTRLASAGLGIALLLYAILGLARWRSDVPARAERWAGPFAGLASGLLTGATGVFVLPAVPYLNALRLRDAELMQALGFCFTVSTVSLAAGLAWHGALRAGSLGPSLAAVVPALLGMAIGSAIRHRISGVLFRRLFFGTLLLLGLEIAWRALAR